MFALKLGFHLEQLEEELVSRTYKPGPLFGFDIPKPAGGSRRLAVPNVRDRVVQAAALEVLQPLFEQAFESESYAYRPGRSYKDAIRRLELLRDEGFTWVVDADIHKYFDEVDHKLLIERVGALIVDQDVLDLIESWISADLLINRKQVPRSKGLPQGSVISPLLANLFLDELDEALLKEGYRLVRYADDFVVLCKSRKRAEKALALTEDVLEDLKLRLHKGKTQVTTFDRGFRFLGSLFVRSMAIPSKIKSKSTDAIPLDEASNPDPNPNAAFAPVQTSRRDVSSSHRDHPIDRTRIEETALGRALFRALDEEGIALADFVAAMDPSPTPNEKVAPVVQTSRRVVSSPREIVHIPRQIDEPRRNVSTFRSTLYIQEQGSWLRFVKERFVVTDGKKYNNKLLSIPAIKVGQVLIFGHCMITPAAMQHCLSEEIPIILLSSRGAYYGQIEATTARDISRQRLQFLHSLDVPCRLRLASQLVNAKLSNLRSLLRRYARRLQNEELAKVARSITRILRKLAQAETLDQIRGYEGSGSAVYFGAFGRLLTASEFDFKGRNRRPPRDPVNALLSFGYTLLFNNIYAMIRLHRMNPYVGMLHEERAGHPALASDLIEEFRFIIDRMVLALCNKRSFTEVDFTVVEGENGGCFLTDDARKRYLRAFEQMMQKPLLKRASRTYSVRQCLDLQVRRYASYLEGKAPYKPFVLSK